MKEVQRKIRALLEAAGIASRIRAHDRVAVKLHFGELKNDTSIPPEYIRPVVEAVRACSGQPFLTDTCVLYKSVRDNAISHLRFAADRGFTLGKTGAPVIIADGLKGSDEITVPIQGRIFKEVSVAAAARDADSLIVLSHVTGHLATGLGGAIKNLGMGFASRKGKLRQHAVLKPEVVRESCTGCGACLEHCPADAIALNGGRASIDPETCIGCGECVTVCRFDAITHDWNRDSVELQQRMAEHALGVVTGRQDRAVYLNFILSVTKDCDCMPFRQKPILPDIGILAGTDPVALDAASLDLIVKKSGKELAELSYPGLDGRPQIKHGAEIGLGSMEYELIEI
ncbi:DUF362 domain-containing protein [bacterium]|nr:DUF362 domain-containing protein [bacterium]